MHDCDIDTLNHNPYFGTWSDVCYDHILANTQTKYLQHNSFFFFADEIMFQRIWNYVYATNSWVSYRSAPNCEPSLSPRQRSACFLWEHLFVVVFFFLNIEISTNWPFCALALNATKNNTKGHERCKQSNGPFVAAGPLGSGPDGHENIIAAVQS